MCDADIARYTTVTADVRVYKTSQVLELTVDNFILLLLTTTTKVLQLLLISHRSYYHCYCRHGYCYRYIDTDIALLLSMDP